MRKYIIVLVLFSLPLVSQQKISFQTDFGFVSKINYQGRGIIEKENFNPHFHFGLNYTYFVKPEFAVETGLGLATYSANIMLLSPYSNTTNEVDSFGAGFEFRVRATNYIEKQRLLMATIPLRIRFESVSTYRRVGVYASGGLKFMLPISQKVDVSASSITTEGFYPNNRLLIKDVPIHGFTTKKDVRTTINSPYNFSVALSTELGVKLRLRNYEFYFGGFLDYGINDIRKTTTTNTNHNLISYTGSNVSTKSNGLHSLKRIDSVRLLSFGLQLRFPLRRVRSKNNFNTGGCL